MNRTVQACRLTKHANKLLAHQLWSLEVTREFIFYLSRRCEARANAHGSNYLYDEAVSSLAKLGKIWVWHTDNCFREHWLSNVVRRLLCTYHL